MSPECFIILLAFASLASRTSTLQAEIACKSRAAPKS